MHILHLSKTTVFLCIWPPSRTKKPGKADELRAGCAQQVLCSAPVTLLEEVRKALKPGEGGSWGVGMGTSCWVMGWLIYKEPVVQLFEHSLDRSYCFASPFCLQKSMRPSSPRSLEGLAQAPSKTEGAALPVARRPSVR